MHSFPFHTAFSMVRRTVFSISFLREHVWDYKWGLIGDLCGYQNPWTEPQTGRRRAITARKPADNRTAELKQSEFPRIVELPARPRLFTDSVSQPRFMPRHSGTRIVENGQKKRRVPGKGDPDSEDRTEERCHLKVTPRRLCKGSP